MLDRVRTETAVARRTIAGAEREIALLREYRTRLIADVVTGKLDVREAAAQLPDESEVDDQSELLIEQLEAEEPENTIDDEVEA